MYRVCTCDGFLGNASVLHKEEEKQEEGEKSKKERQRRKDSGQSPGTENSLERTGDFIIALGRSPLSLVGWHAAPGAGLCVSLICARSEERVYAWTHRSSSLNARPSRRDAARVCSRTRGRVFSDTRCAPFAAHYKLRRRSAWRVRADERARLEMQRGRRARYGIPELARQRHETA